MHIRPGRRQSPPADMQLRAAALERDEIEMLLGESDAPGCPGISDAAPPPRAPLPGGSDSDFPAAESTAADSRPGSGSASGDAAATAADPLPFEWPQLAADGSTEGTSREEILVDRENALDVRIVLGEAELQREAADRLAEGAVVALDAAIGAPVDVLVGRRRVARGEVVVMGETFGIRIAELLDEIDC